MSKAPVVRLLIPRALLSPNRWQGRHWGFKAKDTKGWEQEILAALAGLRLTTWQVRASGPRRVTVTRYTPSMRNFIKDDDNLRFATKPLNDALKRLGLIVDDSRAWLEQPMPRQDVSVRKRFETAIVIEDL